MSIPYRFDDHVTERSMADLLLSQLGITEELMRARQADRGDASKGLTGPLGDSGPVSGNPMQINAPLPTFAQPGTTIAPATTPVPPRDSNPMRVTATANYIQPGTANPAARAGGTVSRKNPMGL